jgi:hypothetical protein
MVPKNGINSQWVYVYVKHSSMKLALFGFLFPALGEAIVVSLP